MFWGDCRGELETPLMHMKNIQTTGLLTSWGNQSLTGAEKEKKHKLTQENRW